MDAQAISEALTRLSERERAALLAHEVSGRDTKSIGADLGLTAGAVAAQLNRSRARLRVEYLLALHGVDPPTERCRPVLLALSSADRRRQGEVGAARHLLECECCSMLSGPLMERGQPRENEIRVKIEADADIVAGAEGCPRAGGEAELLRHRDDGDRHRGVRDQPEHRTIRRTR